MPSVTTSQIAIGAGALLGAYAAGSVNFSLVAARLLGLGDLRRAGSGNAGATNLARVAGRTVALVVLALDIGRGAAVILAASALGLDPWSPLAAIPLLLGNVFPMFHGFKGGKGVAAAVGAVFAVSPFAMLIAGGVFVAVFAIGRRVSAGSLALAASLPIAVPLLGGNRIDTAAAAAIAALLFATHRHNIRRLLAGTEPAFGSRTEPPAPGERP